MFRPRVPWWVKLRRILIKMVYSINWKMIAVLAFVGVMAYGVWAGILPIDEAIKGMLKGDIWRMD